MPRQSYNYSERTGARVGGFCSGVYWIPESQFRSVVEHAYHDPRVLNQYRFEPFPCSEDPPCSRSRNEPPDPLGR